MSTLIERKFIPGRLYFGVAMAVGGVAFLIVIYSFLNVVKLSVLLTCFAAVHIGVLTELSSYGRQCARCNAVLKTKLITISAGLKNKLKAALESPGLDALLALVKAPGPLNVNSIQMKCEFCPTCKSVARIKVAGWPEKVMSGEQVRLLVQ